VVPAEPASQPAHSVCRPGAAVDGMVTVGGEALALGATIHVQVDRLAVQRGQRAAGGALAAADVTTWPAGTAVRSRVSRLRGAG
jgi:hypothetical protein